MQEESTKQKQLSALLNQEIYNIFILLNLNVIEGKIISISQIKLTPDLLESKIYLSIYPNLNDKEILSKIQERNWEIKKKLVEKIKNKVRMIPKLTFLLDDSLEHLDKMSRLFSLIEKK